MFFTVTQEQENYIKMGQNAVDTVEEMYNLPETEWKRETGSDYEDGVVHSRFFKDYSRKVFRLKVDNSCYTIN